MAGRDIPKAVVDAARGAGMDKVRVVGEDDRRGTVYELYTDSDTPTGLPLLVSVTAMGGVVTIPTREAFDLLARFGDED